jgi:hypothetical protein
MFIANYPLKSFIQKAMMALHLPLDYGTFHPYRAMQQRALDETLDFITSQMPQALAFDTPKDLMEHAIKQVRLEGIVAEFGVNEGGSINHMAKRLAKRQIDGFDSFEGLPENWAGNQMEAGYFNRGGKLPKVARNVRLHAGWFSDSLPKFVANNAGPVAFLHVDCDLYSSTATIFEHLSDRIVPGTVILFDEYFNYPAWQVHEHKAFVEFIARTGKSFEYIGYSFKQVAVIIK